MIVPIAAPPFLVLAHQPWCFAGHELQLPWTALTVVLRCMQVVGFLGASVFAAYLTYYILVLIPKTGRKARSNESLSYKVTSRPSEEDVGNLLWTNMQSA